jgi:hypothetical protein
MEWVVPVLECLVELVAAVGPIMASYCEATTVRADRSVRVHSDSGNCPDSAEFAGILRGPNAQIDEGRTDH